MARPILAAMVLAGSLAAPAMAADTFLYDPSSLRPAYAADGTDWSGAYLGVQAGYGWGGNGNDWSGTTITGWAPDGDIDYSGLAGGAYAGYQQQMDNLVFGLEADLSLARYHGDDSQFAGRVNAVDIDAFASLRGRLGWAHDTLLLYGTAGLAAARFTKTDIDAPAADAQLATGWAAGFGAELALADHWRLRAEYLHFGFGDVETPLLVGGAGYRHRANAPALDLVRAGIAYAF